MSATGVLALSAFILMMLGVLALVWFLLHTGRGTRPPTGNSIYAQTIAAVPDDIAETVVNYLGSRLDSPPCNFARITETNADGSLRYRLTIRTNPEGRHQRPERAGGWSLS